MQMPNLQVTIFYINIDIFSFITSTCSSRSFNDKRSRSKVLKRSQKRIKMEFSDVMSVSTPLNCLFVK